MTMTCFEMVLGSMFFKVNGVHAGHTGNTVGFFRSDEKGAAVEFIGVFDTEGEELEKFENLSHKLTDEENEAMEEFAKFARTADGKRMVKGWCRK